MILKHQIPKVLALADQMVVSGSNFITAILITRFAGVAEYGKFTLYWMIFLFCHGICLSFIGLPSQVLSNQAKNKTIYLEENNRLSVLLLLCLLIILWLGFYIYNSATNAYFGYGYYLFPVAIVLFLKQELNRKYFYAKLSLKKVITIDICSYLMQIPSLIILSFFLEITLNLVILNLLFFGVCGQILFQILKHRYTEPIRLNKMPILDNWQYSKHLILTTILQWFSGNFLIISAGGIIGVAAVGIIKILQNIMGVLHILFLTLENVVPVKASILLHEHSKKHMFTYFKKVFMVSGVMYGIILIILKYSGELILSLLYGEPYAEYSNLLDSFILVYILIFFGTIAQLMIKTLKLNHGILIAYVLTVIAAFSLSSVLLNTYHLKGVIIGLGIFQIITLSTYILIIKRHLI